MANPRLLPPFSKHNSCLSSPTTADEVVPKKLAETKKFTGQKILQVGRLGRIGVIDACVICAAACQRSCAVPAVHGQIQSEVHLPFPTLLHAHPAACNPMLRLQLEFGGQHAALLCVPKK